MMLAGSQCHQAPTIKEYSIMGSEGVKVEKTCQRAPEKAGHPFEAESRICRTFVASALLKVRSPSCPLIGRCTTVIHYFRKAETPSAEERKGKAVRLAP